MANSIAWARQHVMGEGPSGGKLLSSWWGQEAEGEEGAIGNWHLPGDAPSDPPLQPRPTCLQLSPRQCVRARVDSHNPNHFTSEHSCVNRSFWGPPHIQTITLFLRPFVGRLYTHVYTHIYMPPHFFKKRETFKMLDLQCVCLSVSLCT